MWKTRTAKNEDFGSSIEFQVPTAAEVEALETAKTFSDWMAVVKPLVKSWSVQDRSGAPIGPPSEETWKELPAELVADLVYQIVVSVKNGGRDPKAT